MSEYEINRNDVERVAETLKHCSKSLVERISDIVTGYIIAKTESAEHDDDIDQ